MLNANNCWHFNIHEHDIFHAQLSWAQKQFYNLVARPSARESQFYYLVLLIASGGHEYYA